MRVDLLTPEYPPHIYGAAGVHVNELARVLRDLIDVRVHAFDGPREPGQPGADEGVTGYDNLPALKDANPALQTLGVDLLMAQGVEGTDLVHSHTWYANMAGHWAHLLHDVPHVEDVQVKLQNLLFAGDDGSDDGEWPPNEPRRARGRS